MANRKPLRSILSSIFYLILVGILVFASISIFAGKWANRSSAIPTLKATKMPEKVVILPTTSASLSTSLTQTPLPSPSTSTQIISSTPTVQPTLVPTPILYPTTAWEPSQKNITADTSDDWLIYVDEKAGYSFKYPSEFHLSAGVNKGDKFKQVHISFPPAEKFRPYISVEIEKKPENLTVEEFLGRKYYTDIGSEIPTEYLAAMEKVDISSFPAIWDKANPYSQVAIVISAQDKIFSFRLSNGVIVSDLRIVDDASKDTFYQIVNTFTLLQ